MNKISPSLIKKIIITTLFISLATLIAIIFYLLGQKQSLIYPVGKNVQKEKPLLAYTFENLKNTKFPSNQIILGRIVDETDDSVSQMFYFSVPKSPNSTVMENVSGLMNIPKSSGIHPVIVMFRGFAPEENYTSGIGTQPSAKVFAKNGFITISPDFLGYGESASIAADPFESRFQTYTAALTLLSSLATLNTGLDASYSGKITGDLSKVGIWGHSNGGQIALTVLEISGYSYPTVLWAPVSKSFPYSILYYTDEADDQGKFLRKILSRFEEDYDADKFSLTNYLDWIKAPVQIHQGGKDEEVPLWWTVELADKLKKKEIDVKYFTYPTADHNLQPSGWSSAVTSSMVFYNKYLGI